MHTLLLRLVAPLQAWGVESHFSVRDSGLEPTKSGVIGLLCAAQGRPRQAPLEDLAALKMGVRVDREGSLRCDFQIAQNVLQVDGKSKKQSITSNRYYLADAAFLVGLEGEDAALLEQLQHALQHPVWTLFLGRKAFPPAAPVWLSDGLRLNEGLEPALQETGWIYPWAADKAPHEVRVVSESPHGEQVRADVPLSFAARTFIGRRVHTSFQAAPKTYIREVQDVSFSTGA